MAPRKADDVVDGEEIGRVVELGDQREFFLKRVADLHRDAVGKAPSRALPSQVFEMRLRRLVNRYRFVGIFVFQLVERKGAGIGDLDGAFQRILIS